MWAILVHRRWYAWNSFQIIKLDCVGSTVLTFKPVFHLLDGMEVLLLLVHLDWRDGWRSSTWNGPEGDPHT